MALTREEVTRTVREIGREAYTLAEVTHRLESDPHDTGDDRILLKDVLQILSGDVAALCEHYDIHL